MRAKFTPLLALLAWLAIGCASALAAEGAPPHYALTVTLDPATHWITAIATITLPAGAAPELPLRLHAGLHPRPLTAGVRLLPQGRLQGAVPLESYLLRRPAGADRVTIRYGGPIFHPLAPYGAEYARNFRDTPGTIEPAGVFLSSAAAWYPQLPFDRCTFRLQVTTPKGWSSVSQGALRTGPVHATPTMVWQEDHPQEEIYCLAGRFTRYQQAAGQVTAMVFLRQPDAELAGRYLTATGHYLAMYDQLLGPYPYAKFALVENFWETGFGMPSFTLLGSTVIRLPFIPYTSFPHEILHNWWGNSVYVDYQEGNWSEGLTAYLADHLLKEQQGEGPAYRRDVLQKYTDFAADGRDFPLRQFTARHSPATEAVGYGKALMLFHMLRQEVGDAAFIKGLRAFYRDNRFRIVSFHEVEASFSQAADRDLAPFFRQWVERTGAPRLLVRDATTTEEKGRFRLSATLVQAQEEEAYTLAVPVAVTMAGGGEALVTTVPMHAETQSFSLLLDRRPLRLDVDPRYDLFRVLDRQEAPPALSQLFGAHRLLIVLPDKDAVDYRPLAETLRRSGPENVDIVDAATVETLPTDRAVLLLGWENRLLPIMQQALAPYGSIITAEGLQLPGQLIARNKSVVAVGRQPANPTQPLGWIATNLPAAIPGLSRKLPHYHKYGYLAFSGEEPTNSAKGIWPVVASPLTVQLSDKSVAIGTLPSRSPLIAMRTKERGQKSGSAAGQNGLKLVSRIQTPEKTP